MAAITRVEVRMVMREDTKLLGIAGTISEMKSAGNENARSLEDGVADISESECTTVSARHETTNIQKLDSPSDDAKVSGPDQDQDQTHPAYIPRRGQFFMHDTREAGGKAALYQSSRADRKWRHDLYDETDQIPLSDREFAKKYGVDREGNPASSELFSALRQRIRGKNQSRIRTSATVWNSSRYFTRTCTIHNYKINDQNKQNSPRKQGSYNRMSLAASTLNEEHSTKCENQKFSGGKEAESKAEINSVGRNDEKVKPRLGKRYSTQRPRKSVEK
ncbi:unnamed protein product [Litomosoides sigmodontis]|uniref:Protein CASC3 n=1 Tax=Litomosoides sigmodontis TaxID=42156 RepID=A0A3P6SED5_LITSI|nr:unnamed protein product [Litomosoides sigmodontis]